ncbi:MAG: YpdA family putative bacillithiol disulfide reductase [Trueperaceae bacterium]|nr:YpdA family putative bacillithiol disulfide reductase [Trueperaceae bacterium]
MIDLLIIGAGPIGLEAAIRAKRAGLSYLVVDKGCVVNAIYDYPTYMTFFTTSDRLEIGGHPMVTATDKPTRKEALDYYRKVTAAEKLDVRQYTEATGLTRTPGGFDVRLNPERGEPQTMSARRVAIATGYFDNPKYLGIPGEERDNVSHYYTEAHPFWNRNVTIIGAGSSAADAALDLYRGGANVTMIHRGADFRHSLKYWIRPNLENRVKEGSITAHFNTVVTEITEDAVFAEKEGDTIRIPTDMTFALTGYYASPELLEQSGVEVRPEDYAAKLDPDTFESNVPGLYIIGSAGFGTRTSDVFIENGLVHAQKALDDIARKLNKDAQPVPA